MNIEDFIGFYPSISDKKFYQKIYNKKEFHELKLTPEIHKNEYILNHQKFIARFLSPYTPYNRLLLYHEMGSGKTCSAISAVELARKQLGKVIQAFYIANTGLHNNFYEEVRKCAYRDAEYTNIKKFINSKNYYAYGYTDFMKIKQFENAYVIIDEIQNIKAKTKTEHNKKYKYLLKLIKESKNCKILLLSGTPMTDQPSEIEDKIQLLTFKKIEIPKLKDGKLVLTKTFKRKFKQHVKGCISFLKNASDPKIKIIYLGNKVLENKLTIFKLNAKPIQTQGYLKAYAMDFNKKPKPENEYIWGKDLWSNNTSKKETTDNFGWNNCIEASLFVWKTKNLIINASTSTLNKIQNVRLKSNVKKDIKKHLANYSIIYHTIIKNIKANNEDIHFIFSNRVNGGGALLFSQILKLFGIKSIYLHDQKSVNTFNENQHKYKVAIGTLKISQGFTLKNITKIHIVTPNWNFAQTAQAIARGIRFKSHNKPSIVEIFLYTVIVDKNPEISVNYEQYKRSAIKASNIDLITDLLRESAVDCELFRLRNNTKKGTCVGVKNYSEDLLTYNLYYTPYEKITERLQDLYKFYFIQTINQIKKELPEFTEFSILATLNKMITEYSIIYNKWGIPSYMQHINGYYFLSMTLFPSNYYYTEFIKNNPKVPSDDEFLKIIFAHECESILTFLNKKLSEIDKLHIFFKNYVPLIESEKTKEYKIIDLIFNFWNLLPLLIQELIRTKINNKYPKIQSFIKYINKPSHYSGKEIFDKFIKGKKYVGIIKQNKLLIKNISNPQSTKNRKKSKKLIGQDYMSISRPVLRKILNILNQPQEMYTTQQLLQIILRKFLITQEQVITEQDNETLNQYMEEKEQNFFN